MTSHRYFLCDFFAARRRAQSLCSLRRFPAPRRLPAKTGRFALRNCAVAALFAPFALSNSVFAQEIDEIIVYGDLRESEIEDVPSSVTVLDEALIRQRNASHFEEMVAAAANLNLSNGASRARFFQIRGVGERGQFTEPLNPSGGLCSSRAWTSAGIGQFQRSSTSADRSVRGPRAPSYGANALEPGSIRLAAAMPRTHELPDGLSLEAGD